MTIMQTQNVRDITFNTFLKEDVGIQDLFTAITLKDSYKWAIIRKLYTKETVDVTVVDRHADTPLRCMLLTQFCKQLSEELRFNFGTIKIILPYVHESSLGGIITANRRFFNTTDRNSFILACAEKIIGKEVDLTVKRGPLRCRDITLSIKDFNLYIRVDNGISEGWLLRDGFETMLPPKELLKLHEENLPCHNINMHDKAGILYNIELQPKHILN